MPQHNPLWKRALSETELFRGSGWFFWGCEVVGAAAFAVAANYFFVADNASPVSQTLWSALGVVSGFAAVYVIVFLLNLVLAPYRTLADERAGKEVLQQEHAADTAELRREIVQIKEEHAAEAGAPFSLNDDTFSWKEARWSVNGSSGECDYLGIDCFNESPRDIPDLSVVVKDVAVLSDGCWVGLKRIRAFHEMTLGACRDDVNTDLRSIDIPPAGKGRWGIVIQEEHSHTGTICAADPEHRTTVIGQQELHRVRLEVSAPSLIGLCFELFVQLSTTGANMVMNGVPRYLSVHEQTFIDRGDERVLGATELGPVGGG